MLGLQACLFQHRLELTCQLVTYFLMYIVVLDINHTCILQCTSFENSILYNKKELGEIKILSLIQTGIHGIQKIATSILWVLVIAICLCNYGQFHRAYEEHQLMAKSNLPRDIPILTRAGLGRPANLCHIQP